MSDEKDEKSLQEMFDEALAEKRPVGTMMKPRRPYIGETVLYYSNGRDEPCAAIVTRVSKDPEPQLNLTVFTDGGRPYPVFNVVRNISGKNAQRYDWLKGNSNG